MLRVGVTKQRRRAKRTCKKPIPMDDLRMTDTYEVFPKPTFKRKTANSRLSTFAAMNFDGVGPYSTIEASAMHEGSCRTRTHPAVLKRCVDCGKTQSKKNFKPNKKRHDGLSARCNGCWLDMSHK